METESDRYNGFTDDEIDTLYIALAKYRRTLVEGVQNEAYDRVDRLIAELINTDRKGN